MTKAKGLAVGVVVSIVLEQLAVKRSQLPSLRGLAKRGGITTWSAWRRGLPGARLFLTTNARLSGGRGSQNACQHAAFGLK
jgi:hypothetical protein